MDSDEFSTSPVPRERSIPWWKIALTNVLFSICLPTLITGLDLAIAAPRRYFLSGILVGSLILTFIGILTSMLGSRTRLSSYMLARIAFGTHGSTLLNLAFALSLLGWFGVNINLFGDAMARLLAALWGYAGPIWPVELLAGLLMTLTTLVGLRAINVLSVIIVPVLALVCLLMLLESLKHGSVAGILGRAPLSGMSFGDAVSSVVGGFIVGAVIMPDTCRFIERPRGAVWTAVLTYFVSSVIVTVIGGIAALATGKVEILDLMLFMGLGAGAFAIVLGGSWILNALNLYSAVLSIGVAVPQSRREITTLVAGVAGTLVAFLQILDHFLTFLFYLSIVFVPIASIIIVDFFLLRPAAYAGAAINSIKAVETSALIAWAGGACVAVLGSAGVLRLTGIAAVDAMLVSALAYGALRWRPAAAVSEPM
ncbi:MAG TPA: cytosine permease [Steroidobacteraceae bacterium]|nr:cytosine permease [Steroidobacteraceae bacterium]